MTELEKLINQREELDAKIKEMQREAITCGTIRREVKTYPTKKVEYRITVKRKRDYMGKEQYVWYPVVMESTEDACNEAFKRFAKDVKALYEKLEGEKL